jgi:dTDP-4-dehydrorhamnose 3,5-epimerase-like enzyme
MSKAITTIRDVRLIDLPKESGERQGNLTYVYENEHVPFPIARIYYLYDVPGGAERAGHAHRELEQILVSVSGSFRVVVDDGSERKRFTLSRPYCGLYIPRLIWRELVDFSSGSVCLALASLPYDPEDYIYEYEPFKRMKKNPKNPAVATGLL